MKNYDNWDECFDDLEGDFWSDYLGGPDDDEIERHYEDLAYEEDCDANDDIDDFDADLHRTTRSATREVTNRHALIPDTGCLPEEIVQWLSRSSCACEFRTGGGFFVRKGAIVRLGDGTIVELLNWLRGEGIVGRSKIGGYSIAYTPPTSRFGEKLSFFSN